MSGAERRAPGSARPLVVHLALTLALAGAPWPASGQGREVHGADSVFAAPGVALAWAVLQGASEAQAQVVVRLAPVGAAFSHVRVEAVDPFTGARRPVLDGRPLTGPLEVRSSRASFAEFPRREFHLYRTPEERQAGPPALTVYYLGVPDTTPEFTSEAALASYLAAALARAGGPGRERR